MRWTIPSALFLILPFLPSAAGAGELQFGTPAVEPLHVSGKSEERVDIYLVGDGYTAGDQALFRSRSDTCLGTILGARPFSDIKHAFNVHRVNLISAEPGIYGLPHDTALRGTLAGVTDTNNLKLALQRAGSFSEAQDIVIVLMNSTGYHGFLQGSRRAIVNFGQSASRGARQMLNLIGTMHGLANEFSYGVGSYYGPEPWEPNVTKQSDPATVKWSAYVGQEGVGVFEGAKYKARGIYRPAARCLMRLYQTDPAYCVVCREAIRKEVLAKYTPAPFQVPSLQVTQRGALFRFVAPAVDDPTPTYEWDFGDGTTGTGQSVVKSYKPGTTDPVHGTSQVVLTVKGSSGQVGSTTLTVMPVFAFDKVRWSDGGWSFDASPAVIATDPLTYSWDFGDSSTGAGKEVSHTFVGGVFFDVVLTVKNVATGMEASVKGFVWVFPPYIPPTDP